MRRTLQLRSQNNGFLELSGRVSGITVIMKGNHHGLLHKEGETRVGGFVFVPWRNLRVHVGQAWAGAGQRAEKEGRNLNNNVFF